MPRTTRLTAALLAASLVAATISGCATTPTTVEDPIAVITDAEARVSDRLAAMDQAAADRPNDPARMAALREAFLMPMQPDELHEKALNQLLAADEAATRAFLRKNIRYLPRWGVVDLVTRTAVERGWVDFTPALIYSLSEPRPGLADADRAEAEALKKLNPDADLDTLAMQTLTDPHATSVEQSAAWHLLARRASSDAERVALIETLEPATQTASALITGYREWGVVPRNLYELTWLRWLRLPFNKALATTAARTVAGLSAEQRAGLALRHLPMLAHLAARGDPLLTFSKTELRRELDSALPRGDVPGTSDSGTGDDHSHPQTYAHWRDRLAWGDLLAIHLLRQAMGDRALVAAFFEQADADLADTTTEHGGHLRITGDGAFAADAVQTSETRHDLTYIAPKALIIEMYTGFVHYHFHCQAHDSAARARPGGGDRGFADRHGFHGLVLTFLDQNTLNIDYYIPGQITIDLGNIHRR